MVADSKQIESDAETGQKEGKERVELMFTRRNISKKTKTKSLTKLFEEGEGELSAGELS